jgi:hypothetical protein
MPTEATGLSLLKSYRPTEVGLPAPAREKLSWARVGGWQADAKVSATLSQVNGKAAVASDEMQLTRA